MALEPITASDQTSQHILGGGSRTISDGTGLEAKDAEVLVLLSMSGDLLALQAKIDEIMYTARGLSIPSLLDRPLEDAAQSFDLRRHDVRLYAQAMHHRIWSGSDPSEWANSAGGLHSAGDLPTTRQMANESLRAAPRAPSKREGFVDRCLLDLERDAEQEGVAIDPEAQAVAARILRELEELPDDTDVYVRESGKVAIEVLRNPGAIFLLHCEPGGSAFCVAVIDRVSRTVRYDDSSKLPDCFLREGLKEVLLRGDRNRLAEDRETALRA